MRRRVDGRLGISLSALAAVTDREPAGYARVLWPRDVENVFTDSIGELVIPGGRCRS